MVTKDFTAEKGEKHGNEGIGLLGLMSNLFAILSIVDSTVHLVRIVNYKYDIFYNEYTNEDKVSLTLMSIRILICLIQLIVSIVAKRFQIKDIYIIILSIIYSIGLTVVMLLSCLTIHFQFAAISLICHIISSFIGIVVSFKLLLNKFNGKQSLFAKVLAVISDNNLAISTLFGVIIAVVIGIIIREYDPNWNGRSLMYIGFIGDLFLRMLKCLVLPLIFTSLVFAMGDIDTKLFGKIGSRTVCYYMGTTVLAIILGIVLVMSIQPGNRGEKNNIEGEGIKDQGKLTTEDTILDLIRNLFPDNIIKACFATYRTVLVPPVFANGSIDLDDDNYDEWVIASGESSGSNILGIVVFAIVLGVIIGQMKEEGKALANFFRAFNNAMMTMTVVVIHFTPMAVMFLVLSQILKVNELSDLLGSVGYYTITVLLGLFIHGLILLPLTYLILTRKSPFKVMAKLSAPMMTAFGTASSTATMPVTFQCLEETLKFDRRIVRFCIPVGATINMDGTALYEAVAAIFIAQYRGIDLDFVKVIIIAITATAASIGAAGIPQAGLVTMVIVLNAVGLPVEDSILIIVIDWLIDRFRTVINVLGDSYGAGIVYHLSKKDLEQLDIMEKANEVNEIYRSVENGSINQ